MLHSLGLLLGIVNMLASLPIPVRLRQPISPAFWGVKVVASALSPALFIVGLITMALGLATSSLLTVMLGAASALICMIHMIEVTRPPNRAAGFENAFGRQWENRIDPKGASTFLDSRSFAKLPNRPEPALRQNIPFYNVPGTNRHLLCDLWQPPATVTPSGLAFVYLHGSAWTVLDKDFGTRTFFRHLVAQGHVVMDVAYRLYPETDMEGMVHDAKHAIAWMKRNATKYRVNPERIVIGGGSAGGHLALLAAYTAHRETFTPLDLENRDVDVCGAISLYGPPDLAALYYHTAQHLTGRPKPGQQDKDSEIPTWIKKIMGINYYRLGMNKKDRPGMLAPMFGGSPEETPEPYARFSPVSYVNSECPPTLILQGMHDLITPAGSGQKLYLLLKDAGVPVVMHLLPQTDHGFDLILPSISPSAHSAYYDVERFLAVMVQAPLQPSRSKNGYIQEQISFRPIDAA